MSISGKYEVVIGLEVHVQLATETKIFAPEKNDFGAPANSDISAVTIAHPGTLPVINKRAIEYGVKIGLAVSGRINRHMVFDRKNYFYPDLPKGYQITQDTTPVCVGGELEIALPNGEISHIQLTKIHLEEDAGKSIHTEHASRSLVDLNRSGVPLIEIVTEPVIRNAEEAMAFLKEIRKLVRHLGISDGNMEEGSMRCDANISLRLPGDPLGSKVEIKNMNSIRNVGRAILHEISRQRSLLESGHTIVSETRTFNADTGDTADMRTKEELNDYRYFPDPDISPVYVDDRWFDEIKSSMPKLPQQIKKELMEQYGLPEYDALFISEDHGFVTYFEQCVSSTPHFKNVSNWLMGPIKSYLNDQQMEIDAFPIPAVSLAAMIDTIQSGKINYTAASQQLFPYLIDHPDETIELACQHLNIHQEGDESVIRDIVEEVLDANRAKVKEYIHGKKGLIGMFMGQVMQRAGGKLDPKQVNKLILEELEKKRIEHV